MNWSPNPEMQKLIEERIKSGQYATPDDVIAAALVTLAQQDWLGEFANGEFDILLAEGEQSISAEGTMDGDDAFRQRRDKRARKDAP
jgi:Arc/MetJ-type ribon-helix-helix transcriptional regulator